jgi:hypothetical protein
MRAGEDSVFRETQLGVRERHAFTCETGTSGKIQDQENARPAAGLRLCGVLEKRPGNLLGLWRLYNCFPFTAHTFVML